MIKNKEIKEAEKYSDKWIALDPKSSTVQLASDNFSDVVSFVEKAKNRLLVLKIPPLEGSISP